MKISSGIMLQSVRYRTGDALGSTETSNKVEREVNNARSVTSGL